MINKDGVGLDSVDSVIATQSKKSSLLEQFFNVGSGFIISLCVWVYVVNPVWELNVTPADNIYITLLFTVVSIVRGYVWRRLFNKHLHKKHNLNIK